MSTSQKPKNRQVCRPFLTKRKTSKNYYVVITNNVTGKRSYKSTGTDDKVTAELFLNELESSLGFASKSAGDATKFRQSVMDGIERLTNSVIIQKTPLNMIWQEYQRNERVRALKPNTLRGYKIILNLFLDYVKQAGVDCVEQITYEVSKAYLDSLRINEKADGTATNHRHTLHGIFKRVKRPLGLKENPFGDVEAPFRPKRKTHRCFTNEELKSLFGAVTPEWRLLMILGYYTGLRFGDCCTFKMDYIDWNNNRINIEPEKTKRYKKRVIIPLHSTLTKALKSYTNALTGGYIFPYFADRYLKRDSDFSKRFGQYLEELEIPKETPEGILDFHSLRHTFNTNLAEGDVDVSTRMKLTGHSSVTVNQIYNHAMKPLERAIECIPEMFE